MSKINEFLELAEEIRQTKEMNRHLQSSMQSSIDKVTDYVFEIAQKMGYQGESDWVQVVRYIDDYLDRQNGN